MVDMYRTRCVVTGVAGAPYYITGYFVEVGGTAQQAADAWFAFCNPGASSMPDDSTITLESQVFNVDSVSGDITSVISVTPDAETGTSVNDFMPGFTQTLVKWQTGTYASGRQVQGRTNLPSVPEGANDNGRPSSTWRTSTQLRADNLLSDVNSIFCVYSRTNGVAVVVQSGVVWDEFSVLRSRRD